MCAMIPMFRSRSSRVLLRSSCLTATAAISSIPPLVPEVAEGPVGLSHPVCLILSLDGAASVVRSVEELVRELLSHAPTSALPRKSTQPAAGQRQPPLGTDLDRDLVGGATHAPRLHLEQRGGVSQGLVENLQGLFLGLPAGSAQGVV